MAFGMLEDFHGLVSCRPFAPIRSGHTDQSYDDELVPVGGGLDEATLACECRFFVAFGTAPHRRRA
jgi:hypothetical protein